MLKKIYIILGKKLSLKLNIVIFLNSLSFIFEFLSISSLPIFASSLVKPDYTIEKIKSFLIYIDFASLSNNDIIKYLGYTVIILFLVKNVFLILLLRYQSFFFRSVKVQLSEKLFDYYINVPYDYYIKGNPSVIVRNLINEIQSVYGYINSLMIFYREILAVLVILVLLIFINPKIVFFLLLLFVIFSLIYQKLIKPIIKKAAIKNQSVVANIVKVLNETFGSIKEIKIASKEKKIGNIFKNDVEIFENNLRYFYVIEKTPRILLELIILLMLTSYALYLFDKVNYDELLPQLALFVILAFRFIPAFNGINTSLTYLKIFKPSVSLIYNEILKMQTFQTQKTVTQNFKKDSIYEPDSSYYLKLNKIFYKYPESIDNTLENISLTINKGDKIGIAGQTGAGKSTLMYLMLGLLKPTHGSIFFRKENIQKNINEWFKEISYVSQNPYLYDSSILDNITFNFETNKVLNQKSKIEKILQISNLDKKLKNLPDGILTNVGNDAVRLSGGEKQRIAIARALYKDSNIFFMDEFTSALDSDTEKNIISNLIKYYPDKTLVIISHRESTLKMCNKIINISSKTIN